MAGDEPWCGAKGGAQVECKGRGLDERRRSFTGRLGDLVTATRGHVVADVAEEFEGQIEPFVGVAFFENRHDQVSTLIEKAHLEVVASALDV